MNLVSFDNTSMASEKYIHPQKYRMKKLRIKKVDAIYFSLSKYMRLEGQFQAKNFQTAYFLQVRILGFGLQFKRIFLLIVIMHCFVQPKQWKSYKKNSNYHACVQKNHLQVPHKRPACIKQSEIIISLTI